jgi:hypothetical protein
MTVAIGSGAQAMLVLSVRAAEQLIDPSEDIRGSLPRDLEYNREGGKASSELIFAAQSLLSSQEC